MNNKIARTPGGSLRHGSLLSINREPPLASNQLAIQSTIRNSSMHEGSSTPSFSQHTTSLKEQRKDYVFKKKDFGKNIQSIIDSSQEVHSGWLKARTSFKRWIKVWCQVKAGYLILYTSQEAQKKHRLGLVLLSVCQVIHRPTKKDGFCFKLVNPFGSSLWAKSYTKALAFSHSSLTLRSTDSNTFKLWADAFQQCGLSANLNLTPSDCNQSLRSGQQHLYGCTSDDEDDDDFDDDEDEDVLRSVMLQQQQSQNRNNASLLSAASSTNNNNHNIWHQNSFKPSNGVPSHGHGTSSTFGHSKKLKHNNNNGHQESFSSSAANLPINYKRPSASNNKLLPATSASQSNMNSHKMVAKFHKYHWQELQLEEVRYEPEGQEELGAAGLQNEEVHDSNKSFLWHIIRQLRPGTDLSRVTLPTFILEPRSFLEKLADYYYHCDILSEAVQLEDPLDRLTQIVKWYLSGFYKKPKGPKKPYNPILGEKFRCFWDHPKTHSRTFFVAEQVSHHPPISAFYVTNRRDGFTISCSLLSRSKYGGNSVSAILEGKAKLLLIPTGETYILTMPYAHCKGLLLGTLSLELGGKVTIECVETGCKCELNFELTRVWASANSYNYITGKLIRANRVTHTIEGHWDRKINITDKRTDEKSVLWEVTDSVRKSRLKRYTVAFDHQGERESVKLWNKVTAALQESDQAKATSEKTLLEDMQRREARERTGAFVPENFCYSPNSSEWFYRWQDNRVWKESRDIMQYEDSFKIKTLILSTPGGQEASGYDAIIDTPLTQSNKFLNGIPMSADPANSKPSARTSHHHLPDRGRASINPPQSLESKMEAENLLIKQALQQVSKKNKELEEDLASLKRGKKIFASLMVALIVAMLSVLMRYIS